MAGRFDRSAEDLGNIVALEHVNVQVEDQRTATLYYMSALGLTRDPYMMTSIDNMWVNVGRSQFHLPTGRREVLRGITGLVLPERKSLLERLSKLRAPLEGTYFDFRESNDGVETISPWGNRIDCHTPDPDRFGPVALGMPYVGFEVRAGTAAGIARFYREVLQAPAQVLDEGGGRQARVTVGAKQYFIFRETWRISRARIGGSRSSASSPRRAASTSTASATSSISIPARCCSRSSTRCAASSIRCMRACWSTAIRRRRR